MTKALSHAAKYGQVTRVVRRNGGYWITVSGAVLFIPRASAA